MIDTRSPHSPTAYRARYVFPIDSAPIAGGLVTVVGQRIAEVGLSTSASDVRDLGNVAILPGLVNTHTHLEFSDLPKPLGSPGMGFASWIAQVTASRGRSADEDGAARAVAAGLRESLAAGTTTIGEIAVAGWSRAPFEAAPLDATLFRELICLAPERIPAMLEAAREHLSAAHPPLPPGEGGRRPGEGAPLSRSPSWSRDAGTSNMRPGLSPHAPYTVHPELFARSIALAAEYSAPVAFHLAESFDELELLRAGTGPFFDYLSGRGFWVPGAIPPGTRPLDYLRVMRRAPRTLVVHGNLLDAEEQAFVAANRDRMSVIYCPRTHAYFDHPRHPLEQFLKLGAHVALGTDGRVSNPDLNLLAEMRLVAREFPSLSGAQVLRLGTLAGAEALGIAGEVGSLIPGKIANLAVIQLPDHDAADPHELLFGAEGGCRMTMVRGAMVT